MLNILLMRYYCLCIYYASTLTHLHLTQEPGWASSIMSNQSGFYRSKRRWEWQCATGTPGHANIQSDHQRQQTNTQFLPYLSSPWKQICIHYSAIFPSHWHLHHYRDQLQYYTNMDSCRVQWCDLLHCGNVILPKAKITPETLIFPQGPLGPKQIWGFQE